MTLKEFQTGIPDPKLDRITARVAQVEEFLKRPGKIKRVVIYARVSSDTQDVANSIDSQIAQATEHITRMGWILIHIYSDEAESGRSGERPQFLKMIDDGIDGKKFDAIVVWKLSRFARDRNFSAIYKQKLKKAKIEVISINEPNDGSPNANFMEGIIESMDQFYSENLSQDVRRGTRHLAERGFFVGSEPAYGYRIIDVMDGEKIRHKLDRDPLTAPIARRIWEMAFDAISDQKIRRTLNEEGIPSPRGGKWPKGSIRSMLKNEHYLGTIVRGLRSHHTDEPIRTPNSHPAIVSQEEFDRVQAIVSTPT